jgi:hypothetical protein
MKPQRLRSAGFDDDWNTVFNHRVAKTHEDDLPLERQLPPEMHAAISEFKADPNEEIPWWQPSWQDSLRHLGWRWIFFIPAIGVLAFAIASFWFPPLRMAIIPLGIKYLLFAGGIAVSAIGFVLRQAVTALTEPFCSHCGYNLTGLPDNYRCPECGRPYSWRVINEYRRDPQWFITRWKASHKLPERDSALEVGPNSTPHKSRDGT